MMGHDVRLLAIFPLQKMSNQLLDQNRLGLDP